MGALLNYRDRESEAAGEPVAAVVPSPDGWPWSLTTATG